MAADDGFEVAAEGAVECRVRAALFRESKRFRQQTDVWPARANHRDGFGVMFNHDFGDLIRTETSAGSQRQTAVIIGATVLHED